MPGYDGAGLIHLRGMRLTKLDADGSPLAGARNGYVTDALSTMAYGLSMSENDAVTQVDGKGLTRYSYRAADTVTEGVLDALTIIAPDPHLLEFLLGAEVVYSVSEVQTLTITGGPTGGTFTLTFNGQTTAGIAYNAAAAAVQTALLALSNLDTGDVVAAGGPLPGATVTLTFGNRYGGVDVPLITANSTGLTGGTTPTATVTTTTAPTTGDTIGVRAPAVGVEPVPNGVAIEGWSNAIIGSAVAATRPYWHNIFPRCRLRLAENVTVGPEGVGTLVMAGTIQENLNFGPGALNDIIYPTDRVFQTYRVSTDPTGTTGFVTVL